MRSVDMGRGVFDRGMSRVTNGIEQVSKWSGLAAAWLVIPLAAVLVWEVFIRRIHAPSILAHDLATMFYGAHFMLPAAYTLYKQKHIRTDFFYEKWSPRWQGFVDAFLYLFLFLPGMAMFLWLSWGFAYESWVLKERLLTPGRPPGYPVKMVIPVAVGLLLLQGISELLKSLRAGVRGRWE
jgi:TRAP-type mannitol/chloroaromatic compound transport system permease small subunit